ncbi:unnamed protein product, partial [marine sediment metagenome]
WERFKNDDIDEDSVMAILWTQEEAHTYILK